MFDAHLVPRLDQTKRSLSFLDPAENTRTGSIRLAGAPVGPVVRRSDEKLGEGRMVVKRCAQVLPSA
jgi:hypothetical protein